MKLPKLQPKPSKTITINDFSGGLNLRDGMSEILDNQLTESKNMWWFDGVLKTRPGIEKISEEVISGGLLECGNDSDLKVHDVYKYDEKLGNCRMVSRFVNYLDAEDNQKIKTEISFWWASKSGIGSCGRLIIEGKTESYFLVQKDDAIYCFISNQEIWNYTQSGWQKLSQDDMYIPLVVSGCRTKGSFVKMNKLCGGVEEEGYNLLSNYYRMVYHAYNDDAALENVSGVRQHQMWYPLLKSVTDDRYKGMKLIVIYTKNANDYRFELTLKGKDPASVESEINEAWKVTYSAGGIRFYDKNSEVCFATDLHSPDDKIEIIAPYIPDEIISARERIFNMTRTEWFGGTTEGLIGGTRLFLCGNTQKNHKSLVCWSGLNNPLYFSDKEYCYVGSSTTAVTGFGKQSDKLIIFKESETWYTQYSKSTQGVYFPITQINSYIGCPYPDTIRLCRNRLVWLSAEGNVSTLITESQYNERSIYSVSEMVQTRLRTETCAKPIAVDWKGCYCLLLGNKIYLMDYNKYGYIHISSYSKSEDASIRIPWHYWEFNDTCNSNLLVTNGELIFISCENKNDSDDFKIRISAFNEKATKDFNGEITSSITTKLFDFDAPNCRKNIERIDLQFGNNSGVPIVAEIISDSGSETHNIELKSSYTDNHSAGYIENRSLFPCVRNICKAAIRLESQGKLIVDGMNITYRLSGKIR